jgi:hypothetical protein
MTEHASMVEYHRKKLEAEKWGEECNYLLAQGGYIEKGFNNNLVTREYHRGAKKGEFEVVQEAWSPKEVMLHFTG